MHSTYKNLRSTLQQEVIEEIDGKEYKTLVKTFELPEEFAEYYRETKDPRVISAVYVNLFGYLKKVSAKYFRLESQDKASFIVEEIWKALNDYDPARGVPFASFLAAYVNRRCYAENKMRENLVRKINYDPEITCSLETVLETVEEESAEDFYASELIDYIKSANLNNNEMLYVKLIAEEPHRMTDSEVARLMGVTPANINYIRKRLQTKIQFA